MLRTVTDTKVSVVVPVYNSASTISATIEHILAQTLPPHEVIAVDDGSTDESSRILAQFGSRVTVLSQTNSGPAAARNLGVRAAAGEFVAFTDSDCLPVQNWLESLITGFNDPRVGGVGGVTKGINNKNLVSQYFDFVGILNPGHDSSGEIAYLTTGNACFRRDVFLRAGLFDERFRKPGGEEPELCKRIRLLGYHFLAVDEAVVLHYNHQTVRSFLRSMSNYGEGRFLLDSIWPDDRLRGNLRNEMIRHAIAMRTMFRRGLANRPQLGLRRAMLFSFLDQMKHSAMLWGYLRGQKKFALTSDLEH